MQQSTIREERDGLNLRYSIEVYGKAPPIVFFGPEDDLVHGPVPSSAPTHKEMIEHVTPQGVPGAGCRPWRAGALARGAGEEVAEPSARRSHRRTSHRRTPHLDVHSFLLMKITVAHSPDSDDAFMHYGLASGKVPTEGIEFGHLLADIETLNQAAFEGKYEVSAVSFHAYAHLTDKYLLLPHGSSMGDDYGPIVVARLDGPSSTKGITVAVPGTLTTALLALRIFDPDVEYVVMPFDRIQDAVRRRRSCRRPTDPRGSADVPG